LRILNIWFVKCYHWFLFNDKRLLRLIYCCFDEIWLKDIGRCSELVWDWRHYVLKWFWDNMFVFFCKEFSNFGLLIVLKDFLFNDNWVLGSMFSWFNRR
jgi:hypothetical protein